jgi:hypothetical protein
MIGARVIEATYYHRPSGRDYMNISTQIIDSGLHNLIFIVVSN